MRLVLSAVAGGAAFLMSAGCPTAPPPPPAPSAPTEDGNRDPTVTSPLGKTSGEPNGTFEDAIIAVFNVGGEADLWGTISETGDLDVYNLGGLMPSDHIVIDVDSGDSRLDSSIALFDARGRLVYANDDRSPTERRFLDSFIDFTIRRDSDPYYLVITHSAFADPGTFTGTYAIAITVTPGGDPPPPRGQILLLDFDGAVVDAPSLTQPLGMDPVIVDPLDAAAISPVYAGQTEALKQAIREGFEQNFARFDVTILTTDDPPPADESVVSTLVIGGFNPELFGIAENVDLYNLDACDDAIIFAESFNPHVFSFTPTIEELGVGIANVGSHEAGHLLGLNHVDDDTALMDDRSVADAFLADQEFKEAPLSTDLMDIGTQDAALLLYEIVGPYPGGTAPAVRRSRLRRTFVPGPSSSGTVYRRRMSKSLRTGRR
ncbi:MAG: hypothetical protein D6788_07030 [Planctomycetota bacterium]|nr:MAG: hypothetical protein D6788_07030 [Planctomycetota bacterium]